MSLDQPLGVVARLRRLLAPDEQLRADRFHFEIDRQRFSVARGGLRTILSRYVRARPEKIQFAYDAHGKPRLVPSQPTNPLKFNLAHSGGIALCAVTRLGDIGVDVERIRPEFAGEDIARRFFSASEVARLEQLPAETRQTAFFNCWTRKEAFLKATGVGLSLPLDQFDVTLAPGEPAALVRTAWDENEPAFWSLASIDVGAGHAAAVAIRTAERPSGRIASGRRCPFRLQLFNFVRM
jgi:4'-phosphopantetheinyl transferase